MNKTEIIAVLNEREIPLTGTETLPQLKKMMLDSTPSDEDDLTKPTTQVVNLKRLDLVDITRTHDGFKPWKNEDSKSAKNFPQGYVTYVYDDGSQQIPFVSWDLKFVNNFDNNTLHSVRLTSEVTGTVLPADEYNEARYEVLWSATRIITKKEYRDDKMETFQDDLFDIKTFTNNPELLKQSGFLDKVLEESIGN
jgi:hypothetical protein